jgi:hypothetical protein
MNDQIACPIHLREPETAFCLHFGGKGDDPALFRPIDRPHSSRYFLTACHGIAHCRKTWVKAHLGTHIFHVFVPFILPLDVLDAGREMEVVKRAATGMSKCHVLSRRSVSDTVRP